MRQSRTLATLQEFSAADCNKAIVKQCCQVANTFKFEISSKNTNQICKSTTLKITQNVDMTI